MFKRKTVTTHDGDTIELIDRRFCANDPVLYAIADALGAPAIKKARSDLRVVSIGVGAYPAPWKFYYELYRLLPLSRIQTTLIEKMLEFNTQSMDNLIGILFSDIPMVCIDVTFANSAFATDMMEKIWTSLIN